MSSNQNIYKMYPKMPKRKKLSLKQRICYHFVSCAKICSIHGLAHIVRKNISPYERLLWFLLVTSATTWCIGLGLQAWNRYQTRPTVISLERDHWKWNTTFPAATLCLNGIDDDRAETLISESKSLNETDHNDFKNFLTALANANFSLIGFDKYINVSVYQEVDKYIDWVLRAMPLVDPPAKIVHDIGELQKFETILTEFGVCFAYNSRIAIYSSPVYWAKRTNKLVDLSNQTIIINPSIPDLSFTITSLPSDYQIFFHGFNEIPEISTKGIHVPSGTSAHFDLSIESVSTSSEVKKLKISQRKCRMSDESNLKYSPVYSYNLCRIECRRNLCLKLCNCTPYYYRRLGKEKICDPSGMRCLHNHKNLLMHFNNEFGRSNCSCIQNCDIENIIITKQEIIYWFMGTWVDWKVPEYPTIRYKRSLIFSRINLYVQIGGIAGLFLGCSVLSLIELLYFFSLRFYWGVVKRRTI